MFGHQVAESKHGVFGLLSDEVVGILHSGMVGTTTVIYMVAVFSQLWGVLLPPHTPGIFENLNCTIFRPRGGLEVARAPQAGMNGNKVVNKNNIIVRKKTICQ